MAEPKSPGAWDRSVSRRVVDARHNVSALIGFFSAFLGAFSSTAATVLAFGSASILLGLLATLLSFVGLRDDRRLAVGCVLLGLVVFGYGLWMTY